jgi:hypothetical protein
MNEKIIYLAGIFDGEGTIAIVKNKPGGKRHIYNCPRLIITNTNLNLMLWLKKNFGGNIRTIKPKNPNYKPFYQWIIGNKKALNLLKKMLPYLIVKKEKTIFVLIYFKKSSYIRIQ